MVQASIQPTPEILNRFTRQELRHYAKFLGVPCGETLKFWQDNLLTVARRYGFTDVRFIGIGPTLMRNDQYVEIPY